MSKRKVNLVCVAHPDDETIFFGGLIQRMSTKKNWVVVCATSDGQTKRQRQFEKACRILGVKETQWWGYADIYNQRLPIDALVQRLAPLAEADEVYTHGIVGEYGHPHHQDVSFAVHKAFKSHPKLYSVAYNAFPEFEIRLNEKEYQTKAKLLTEVYSSETNRFLNVLPSTFSEGFLRLNWKEVESVYNYLARKKALRTEHLKANKWLAKYLSHIKNLPRPF